MAETLEKMSQLLKPGEKLAGTDFGLRGPVYVRENRRNGEFVEVTLDDGSGETFERSLPVGERYEVIRELSMEPTAPAL